MLIKLDLLDPRMETLADTNLDRKKIEVMETILEQKDVDAWK